MKIIRRTASLLLLTVLPLTVSAEQKFPAEHYLSSNKAPQKAQRRNYNAAVNASEKKELRYILKALAQSSLLKITWNSSSLTKAGDRIAHLHPFKFLECMLTDEELSGYVRHFQGRSWVWKEFLEGVTGSLEKEMSVGNLKPHLTEFADQVKVDVNLIKPLIQKQQWKELVNTLISHTNT